MDYSELRQEKIKILNRLIRESNITLEKIWMLLQEQEQPKDISTPDHTPETGPIWTKLHIVVPHTDFQFTNTTAIPTQLKDCDW